MHLLCWTSKQSSAQKSNLQLNSEFWSESFEKDSVKESSTDLFIHSKDLL